MNDLRRIRMVKYLGPIEGHTGKWVDVDWDTREAKHDGYRRSQASGLAVRWRTGRDGLTAWDGDEDEDEDPEQISKAESR